MTAPTVRVPAAAAALLWVSACLLGVWVALWVVYPRMTAVEHSAGHAGVATDLPWSFEGTEEGHRLEVTLPVHPGTSSVWRIVPDDELTELRVNGNVVPLSEARPKSGVHDFLRGFTIDLGQWLHWGNNKLEFAVKNTGGWGGVIIHPVVGWRALILAAGLLPSLLALARLFRLSTLQKWPLGLSLVVLCAYWGATPWHERNYDVKRLNESGHIGYVIYVARNWSLPPPDDGWQYYQPPGYYGFGAAIWKVAAKLGISGPEAIQCLSLCLWLVFLVASAAALKLTLRRSPLTLALATAALGVWPSGIISSSRISNDLALYAASAVATYFMIRWWKGQRRRHLAGMALSVAAAFVCKSSGMALLGAALVLVGLRLLRRRRWRRLRPWLEAAAAGATMLAGVALGLARNIWYWKQGKLASWLVSNIAGLDDDLRVSNEARNFIPLDVPVFLSEPWVNTRVDATGRANYWNFFLRSSLSGEFEFNGKLHQHIALAWGVILLLLVLTAVARPLVARPTLAALWRDAPWYALGLLWLGSSLSLRATYPFSCQSDFRYVIPAIVPFVFACARGHWVARGLLSLVIASSVVFFVSV
jgi:hypothetical protein